MPSNKVRTRFAPSPTGYMHVGNLRTALYTYLMAKHEDGTFILRIEDTDQGRYVEGAVDVIYNTLRETGLLWDEGPDIGGPVGPYVQSERMGMFVVTLSKASVKKLGVGAMCCALVVFSAMLGRYISTRSVAVAAASNKIESAQDIQTWFTGYGLDVDGASITADKVKIPRKWDDSFSAFNGVVQQSGMDLARYKGKTVEKWTALIPAASRGDVSSYGVLLVYKKKAVGAYLLEKPSGTVTGLKDAQTAMALQEAEQVSGEDFSGDWGERHEDELTDGQAQQTSGEDFSGDWGERHDDELGAEGQAQQTSGEPDAAQEQPVQYTDLPLDAEGYPVE